MTHRVRILTRYPAARCIRHRGGDGLTHYNVYAIDPIEWPDAIFPRYGLDGTPGVEGRGEAGISIVCVRRMNLMADEDFDPELSRSIAEMRIDADRRTLVIDYTNYRGIRSVRRIIPMGIRWGATEYHPEEQWLLEAFDRDKGAERTFAVKDIHSWRELGRPEELNQ